MTKKHEIYRCPVCGNIVEVMNPGAQMVCCGKPMELMEENTTDASAEKHVPVITPINNGYRVSIGSTPHPMTQEHYIQWIELITDHCVMRKELQPDEAPEAVFMTCCQHPTARAYCNLHGLWKG